MAVLMTVLRVLGIVLLVLLALFLVLLTLALFVPVRYSFTGAVRDPEGSAEPLHLDPRRDISFESSVGWLFGAARMSAAAGPETGSGGLELQIRVFGFSVPPDWVFPKKRPEQKREEGPPKPKETKTVDERIDEILNRIERIWNRIEDALRVLETPYGVRAKGILSSTALNLFEALQPDEWGLTGTLGLGDPARSARVFAVQGFLYPVTAGHVAVGTDYELYRYDLQGAARGGFRLFYFAAAGIRLVLSRDVRRLLKRLRRGPGRAGARGQSPNHADGKQAAAY